MNITSPVGTVPNSGNKDTSWSAAMSAACPRLSRVPRITEASALSLRASSSGPSVKSSVPVSIRLFTHQSHPIPVWIDIYAGDEFGVINHWALSKVTLSAEPPHSVRLVHSRSLYEAENIEFVMREIRLKYSVFERRALEAIPNRAYMSLGWLREVLQQGRMLQRRNAVPKPEASEVIGIKDENKEMVV